MKIQFTKSEKFKLKLAGLVFASISVGLNVLGVFLIRTRPVGLWFEIAYVGSLLIVGVLFSNLMKRD